MKNDWEFNILIGFLSLLVIWAIFGFIFSVGAEEHTTDKIVDCNDEDGDVIEGLVCYEVVLCSNTLKFLNSEECERRLN